MPFDAAAPAFRIADLIATAGEPCPIWAAENPERALAFLFVAPSDCAAVDALVAL